MDPGLDDLSFAVLNRLRGRRHPAMRRPCGLETIVDTPAGTLLIRHMHIPWLVDSLARRGLRLQERRAGQFTEFYTYLGDRRAAERIHRLNRWLRHHGPVGLSFGTLLVFSADRR